MIVPSPFAQSSSYPVRSAASLDFFVDGENAFAAIAQAVESAQSYVYVTCAFASLNFRLRPPNQEQFLDLCARVSARGVRVALLFWQPLDALDRPSTSMPGTVPENLSTQIAERAPQVLVRWDVAKTTGIYPAELGCHHQKTFVIDGKIGFVGGINMTQDYWDSCHHASNDDRRVSYDVIDASARAKSCSTALPLHDVFSRFTGPSVLDVEANFVERWNGATVKTSALDLAPGAAPADPASATRLQVVRTIAPSTYPHTASGEQSIKEAMLNVIGGARRSIYFENQYFFDDDVVAAIRAAGERGVRVVGLLTREPDAGQFTGVLERWMDDRSQAMLQWTHLNPALANQIQLYTPYTSDQIACKDIYVHSKTMIVDDRYIIAGSANISFTSMDFHSEMSVLVDDAGKALALRRQLWSEHLCCGPEQVEADFLAGADQWARAGAVNCEAIGKRQLATRIVPWNVPRVGDQVSALDGANDDTSFT
jgi:phosphatidylserine/phosphatidylglycerophosphate/cardiolipin synthase-like enzyme